MAALSANRITIGKSLGPTRRYKMKASTTIYAGSIVMLDAAGLAIPATATASNQGCPGVAKTKIVSPSSGDTYITVQEGTFKFAATSVADTSLLLLVYASNDQTIDETQASNEPVAGILQEVESSTVAWIIMAAHIARG